MASKMCKCKKVYRRSMCGREFTYKCKCGKTERVLTVSKTLQKRILSKEDKPPQKHKLCQSFIKAIKDKKGFKAMEAAEKWAKKNPGATLVGCDDDHFASSIIAIIPHENRYEVWGYTMICIPQCTGEEPMRMFFYPAELKSFISVLQVHAGRCRAKGNRKLGFFWRPKNKPSSWDLVPKSFYKGDKKLTKEGKNG
jgi:hypothetical protein